MLVHSNLLEITQQHKNLVERSWNALGNWRKFLIAVDGRDDAGKSTTARFLAWQMNMPAIETDLLLENDRIQYDKCSLKWLINARLCKNWPVIVEGIFLLRTLKCVGLEPDYLIYVENKSFEGSHSLQHDFAEYEKEFKPQEKAEFRFSWEEQ